MRKRSPHIRQSLETPFLGYGVVLLALACLLIFLWSLIIVVRIVLG